MNALEIVALWALVSVAVAVAHHRVKTWDKQVRRTPQTLDLTRWRR